MEKLRFLFPMAALMFASFIVSCGSSDDGGSSNDEENDQFGATVIGENGQKEYLDKVGIELTEYVKADDFKPLSDLKNYIDDKITSRSQTSAIDDFFETAINSSTITRATTETVYRLFLASTFAAEFTYQDGRWVNTGNGGGNTLRFIFNDQNGTPCVAEVVASGEQIVHSKFFDDKDKEYYYNSNYDWGYNITYYENSIGIPQRATAKLTQGSTTLAEATVTISCSTGEFLLSAGSANVTADANVVGYRVVVDKAIYNGGKDATVSVSVSKGDKKLASASVVADVKLDGDGKFVSGGSATVNADVLGKVQVKGTVANLSQLYDQINKGYEKYDENDAKSWVDGVNSKYELNLYYNGKDTRQAYIQLYPFAHDSYYYNDVVRNKWKAEPVIYFADGTGYSTLADFFDETTFKNVIDRFNSIVKDFEKMF